MGVDLFNTFILLLLVAAALTALRARDLITASVVFGVYSFLMCLLWAEMGWLSPLLELREPSLVRSMIVRFVFFKNTPSTQLWWKRWTKPLAKFFPLSMMRG